MQFNCKSFKQLKFNETMIFETQLQLSLLLSNNSIDDRVLAVVDRVRITSLFRSLLLVVVALSALILA